MKSDTFPWTHVVIEQYEDARPTRIAKFVEYPEAKLFADLLNSIRANRSKPYVVRALVSK